LQFYAPKIAKFWQDEIRKTAKCIKTAKMNLVEGTAEEIEGDSHKLEDEANLQDHELEDRPVEKQSDPTRA
jgi:hypothetical protein